MRQGEENTCAEAQRQERAGALGSGMCSGGLQVGRGWWYWQEMKPEREAEGA